MVIRFEESAELPYLQVINFGCFTVSSAHERTIIMRASDFLFQLIKAMTKGDRRNFKLFAQLQEGDKKYIQLFDAIERQEEYDERLLLQQFEGERFTNQFSVAKNYLYRYILKTLHVFQKDPYSEFQILVHQVKILMSKNLFDQAHKLLRKAMHQAEAMEYFSDYLSLLQMEREIYFFNQKSNEFAAFIMGIQAKEKEVLAQLDNFIQFSHIQDELKLIKKSISEVRSEKDNRPFEKIRKNGLMSAEGKALSVRAKIKQLVILNDCAASEGNFAQCKDYSEKILSLYESNSAIKDTENHFYLLEITNLAIIYYRNGLEKEAFECLEKLRAATVMNQQEEIRVFEKYSQVTLAIALEKGNIMNGKLAAEAIEDGLQKLDGKIRKSVELVLYFHLASFWLMAGNPSEGLRWINKFLNEPKTELRVDLQCMARILNIILHYELGNQDLVEYALKSASRFIFKRQRMLKFEKLVLSTLRGLSNAPSENDRKAILTNTLDSLSEIMDDPFENKANNLFDFQSWAKSKLNRTSMALEKQKRNGVVTEKSIKAK